MTLGLRVGTGVVPPFDDLYHLKRIEWTAHHAPQVLEFDRDRGVHGEFVPWPPLYDFGAGLMDRLFGGVSWLPPLFFALFAAGVTAVMTRFGWLAAATAGITLATSPYLIGVSMRGHLDHHYVEPLLLLLIVVAVAARRPLLLGCALAAALLVQTALLVAAAIAFLTLFVESRKQAASTRPSWLSPPSAPLWSAFAIPAAVIGLYRVTRPPSYPDSEWFLGWPHVAALGGAAVALSLRDRVSRPTALLAGVTTALAIPSFAPAFFGGIGFFHGDAWLRTILEFQPMFSSRMQVGTDLANLTGGALLALLLYRRFPVVALFASAYLLLALSSRRFLVPAIALFAVGGALGAATARRKALAVAAALLTLVPPVAYDLYAGIAPADHEEVGRFATDLRQLPPGRFLGPWSFGHAIDVIARQPVVIDNFGSMPDPALFENANDALRVTRTPVLLGWCRAHGVRYLVLTDPERGLGGTAAVAGLSPAWYDGTRLARRTVWWRLYHGEEHDPAFRRVRDGVIQVWEVEGPPVDGSAQR